MTRPLNTSAVALMAVLAVGACSKAGDTTSSNSTQTPNSGPAAGVASTVDKAQDATSVAVGTVSAAMPTTAKGFVTAAANSDMYETKAAEIALKRSTSPKVKAFAEHMIHDHAKSTAALKALLGKGDLADAALPADTDARRTGLLDNLRSATADGFDKTYLDQQVAAHDEANTLMSGFAEHGDNAALKGFAAKVAPTVREHLDMVKALDEAAQATPAKTPG
jgi:putative membrane protein